MVFFKKKPNPNKKKKKQKGLGARASTLKKKGSCALS